MTCSSQDLLSYCTFVVINRVPFWTLKISLYYCDVRFVLISATLLGRSNVYDTFSCINKGYKNSRLPKTDRHVHLLIGMYFLAPNSLMPFMTDVSDRL